MNRLNAKTLCAILLPLCILLAISFAASARPGGGQTHSSSHSSSSYSSHSSSSSAGSSLGRSSSSSSSYGGGGGVPITTGGGGGFHFGFVLFLFMMVFVIIVLLVVAKQFTGSAGTSAPVQPDTGSDLAEQMAALRRADRNFSEVLFIDFVNALYARAQEFRGKGTVDLLTPYIDDASRQKLLSLGSAVDGLTEVAGVVLGTSKIVDVSSKPHGTAINVYFENDTPQATYITVYFEANYTETRQGGAQTSYYTEERWRFVRQAGVLSLPPGKIDAIHCPKCGGPLERTSDGACPYCNTVVKGGEFHWFVVGMEVLDREHRGPQLTEDTPEEGNDLPTVYMDNFQEAAAQFQAANPDFTWERMNERVNYIFHAISQAWTTLEWDKARPFETDNIFQMHQYWIEAYKRQGLRNVLDKIQVSRIEWCKLDQDAYYDSLTARIYASELDYTVDQSGRVVCGSSTQPREFTEYWTFIRTRGAKTVEQKDDHCPNCGAPLAVNMAGVCDYCGGKITSGNFDWVLCRIDQDEAYTG
jgi:predicted lipid-binding transport protein (Tim44 family)